MYFDVQILYKCQMNRLSIQIWLIFIRCFRIRSRDIWTPKAEDIFLFLKSTHFVITVILTIWIRGFWCISLSFLESFDFITNTLHFYILQEFFWTNIVFYVKHLLVVVQHTNNFKLNFSYFLKFVHKEQIHL